MNFTKEYCPSAQTVVIRSGDRYGSDLQRFMDMYEEACQDGFRIEMSDVKIVHYAGNRYAGTFGIEFQWNDAPDEYNRINQLEYYR